MALRAIMPTAASGMVMPSSADTRLSTSAICSSEGRPKSNRWQRSMIVAGTLCASVVASTNTTCPGGSSSVFRNAFQAAVESMCASSRMYTRREPPIGDSDTFSRSSRMSSTELLDAASISTTSSEVPFMIALHAGSSGEKSVRGPPSAFMAQASSLAIEVLPVPREPTNR